VYSVRVIVANCAAVVSGYNNYKKIISIIRTRKHLLYTYVQSNIKVCYFQNKRKVYSQRSNTNSIPKQKIAHVIKFFFNKFSELVFNM
jgi:hypothetical protein